MSSPITTDLYLPSISRRTLLKGLGAAVALPWLRSLAWAEGGERAVTAGAPPRRWATLLFANGVKVDDWWAREQGGGRIELSRTLAPLAPHTKDLLFLNGLRLFDNVSGVHWPYFTNFLAGEKVKTGSMPDVAESLDQYLARTIGAQTSLPVLNLAVEPVQHGVRSGVPSVYFGTISWSSETTPVAPEIYPQQAFDRLFDTRGLKRDRSVLDGVLDQAKGVERKLDRHDRDKLGGFMESVRSVERRLERAAQDTREGGAWHPSVNKPTLERPAAGLPSTVREHMRLMIDIQVLAFQMDKTRVSTLLFNNDGTYDMKFNFLEGVSGNSMHVISHHNGQEKALADYQKINQFHVELFAYYLEKMKAVDEGNGSLLDNSMVLFGSTMMDGMKHDGSRLPLVLAGKGGGTITPGRVLDFERTEDRRLCNLHLALLQRMGVPATSFGNSHHALKEIA
jgi:hypothetical protein